MKPAGKKETLLAFLERGIAMLHVDARRPGVKVPAQHQDDPHLRINLSFRYGIPDLVIDETHVQATLSFGGRPFQCQLPWTAVFGITSQTTGDGQVWPEDLPTEVMSALAEEEQRKGAEKLPAPPPKKPSRPTLVAVASDSGLAEKDPSEKDPEENAERDPDGAKAGEKIGKPAKVSSKPTLAAAPMPLDEVTPVSRRTGPGKSAPERLSAEPKPVGKLPAEKLQPVKADESSDSSEEKPPPRDPNEPPKKGGHLRLIR